MPRPSHKQTILDRGLQTVHQHGYGAAGVRDIIKAAGVPQGSFTNHFPTKEAFGLEILNLYYSHSQEVIKATLLNDSLPPRERLERYLEANRERIIRDELRNGCLYGNFSAEVTEQSELIRERLNRILNEIRGSIAHCLSAAVAAGEVAPLKDVDAVAGTLLSSLQGAILLVKTTRNIAQFDEFRSLFLETVLHRPDRKKSR